MSGASILGTRVQRKEDPKFLTTGGVYSDDVTDPRLEGAAFAVFVRSMVAHGRIESIDIEGAVDMPGVIAVHTAESLGLEPRPSPFNPMVSRSLLASGKVRHVGEPVAVVIAEPHQQAAAAAEMVFVDVDFLPAVVDMEEALTSETLLYDEAGSNAVFDTTALGIPENTSTEEFFADCEVTISGRFLNQRVAPCPLETRSSAAVWDGDTLVQWISTQQAQGAKRLFTAANGGDDVKIHLITPDVGGGFGAKIDAYAEELVLGTLAKAVGRPVRYRETRSESMMNLGHGRAQLQYVTMGGTRDGKVTHLQVHAIQDAGAAAGTGTVLAAFYTRPMIVGVYDIANVECRATSVVTNTTPTTAYRGAGRPEATAAIERAMDLFALELGKDPAEVRRANLIPKFDEPYTTAVDQTYDVGDYEAALDQALEAAGYDELRAEQARRRDANDPVQLGIGVCVYVEITGGVDPKSEDAKIEVHDDGTATVYTGTTPQGQGHDTAWSMLTQAATGIPMDKVTLVFGDTERTPTGGGTMASRSLQQGGAAVNQAAGELVEQAKQIAAKQLEAADADIVLDTATGSFHVAGTPSMSKSWADLAVAARQDGSELTQASTFTADMATFPFGAHISVVEVDTGTGRVTHLRQVACDDAGRILNPLLLDGQIHGGIAQGSAQALIEEVRYDEDGNPITSNLADYGMISATELPSFEVIHMETPTFVNPLGAKGIGASGTLGSPPAVQSAVCAALSRLGVTRIDKPATSERVWQAINSATSTD